MTGSFAGNTSLEMRVLLVDPNADALMTVKELLGQRAQVLTAAGAQEADQLLASGSFDLILMETDLNGESGLDYCSALQCKDKTRSIPVIFFSSRSEVSAKVMAFTLGAEDYILKSADHAEIRARLVSKINRSLERRSNDLTICKGDLKVSVPMQKVSVLNEQGETPVELTPFEFKLLLHFVKHEDHVLSRTQLMGAVWGDTMAVVERAVDVHVSNLRKKLNVSRYTIKSVHRMGYRFQML